MAMDFLAGSIGGCAGVFVGHPFDTVKVKIQTQDFRNPVYRGTSHCLITIIKTESVRGLFKGVTSPMAGVGLINAAVFGVYGIIQRQLSPSGITPSSCILAGGLAGFVQSFICSPLELAKTRLQVQSKNVYNGTLDCLWKVTRTEGIKGVYRGLAVTVTREIPAFGAYFYTYEVLLGNEPENATTFRMLLAGGLAGCASWIISYPIDVIKSRLQTDGFQGTSPKYSGALDCFKKSIRAEGYSVLFRGLNSTLVRAFPTNAVTFATVTWFERVTGIKKRKEEHVQQPKGKHSLTQDHKRRLKFGEGWKNALHHYEDDKIF